MLAAIFIFLELLFNFNWLSCFLLLLDFTEPSPLQPTPTTYLRMYVDLSCWRQFHFSIASREPVNGHKDYCVSYRCRFQGIHTILIIYNAKGWPDEPVLFCHW